MRLFLTSIALATASIGAAVDPASAQSTGAAIIPGMPVVDTAGGTVGRVIAVKDNLLTIKTDRHEAVIGTDSVTPHEGKLLFGMSQAELNAAIDRDVAAADAALVPGAVVKGASGAKVGTLDAIDAEAATIKLESGNLVRIPRSGIRGTPGGETVIGLTADQLEAEAATSSQPAAEPAKDAADGASS